MLNPLIKRILLFSSLVLMLFLIPVLSARASPAGPAGEQIAGTIEARLDGQTLYFPTLKTDISADIQGDLATVTVVQTFANPTTEPLHARYLFPLNQEAAVYEMQLEVGDERIRAQIQEKKQAEQTFEKAKSEGKAAALLKEHRPNMFTQDIANLMPGLPIKVTLRYVQTVPKIDGDYELVIPLVVGPRFQPPQAMPMPAADEPLRTASAAPGQWELTQLPTYPPVHGLDLPPSVEPERVSLNLKLNGGMSIQDAQSATHAITTRAVSNNRWNIALSKSHIIDNRDFVLRYHLGGERTQAGLLVQRDAADQEGGGFFSLLLEPPTAPVDSEILPREMVFLLDCSGSMYGLPMDASKAFMREALRKLRPSDYFRIIRFSDNATEFAELPLTATPDNIRRGIEYTDQLEGEGGTMMDSGIRQALAAPAMPETQRIVVFLTDGYIGNENQILGLIHELLGDARLYTFGVGTGVNRYLMDEIGRAGRGFTRYMDPTEKVEKVAAELTDRLQSPVLTDIEIDWGNLKPDSTYPAKIPDLFAGQSLRIQGRYTAPGDYLVRINGNTRGRRATLLLPVHLPERTKDVQAIGLVWARSAIKEAMYQLSIPEAARYGLAETSDDQLKQRVTALGLKFSLLTRWTSFVAVSEKIYNTHPENTATAPIPLPMVAGVSSRAYGNGTQTFVGAAGPEAREWAGMLMILLILALLLRRRPRITGSLG